MSGIVFRFSFWWGFGFFGVLSWYNLPCICNNLEVEPVILHGICYFLALPSILPGICSMFGTSTFHFCMVFAAFWDGHLAFCMVLVVSGTNNTWNRMTHDDAWYAHTPTELNSHQKATKHGDTHEGNWLLRASAPNNSPLFGRGVPTQLPKQPVDHRMLRTTHGSRVCATRPPH